MEKIVVMSGDSGSDNKLIKCLRELFPECEIDIQPKVQENYDSVDPAPDNSDETDLNEELEKYLSFL